MAYATANLRDSGAGPANRNFIYDTTDSWATVSGANYFSDFVSVHKGAIGDTIEVRIWSSVPAMTKAGRNAGTLTDRILAKVTSIATNAATVAFAGFVTLAASDAEARAVASAAKFLTPANLAARACFSVHKNSSDQSGIASATPTLLTFGAEEFDVGGYFASDTWTPPAGPVRLSAAAFISSGQTVSGETRLDFYKNGSVRRYGQVLYSPVAGAVGVYGTMIDVANGTDAYTVRIYGTSGGTLTVSGSPLLTYFMGEQI